MGSCCSKEAEEAKAPEATDEKEGKKSKGSKKGKKKSEKPDTDGTIDAKTGMKVIRMGKLKTEEEYIEEEQQRTAELGTVQESSVISEEGRTALMNSMNDTPSQNQCDAQSVQFDSAYEAHQISRRESAPKK